MKGTALALTTRMVSEARQVPGLIRRFTRHGWSPLALAAGILILTLGCGGTTPPTAQTNPSPDPTIRSFTANPAVIPSGGSTQLTALFSNGTGIVTPGDFAITSGIPLTVSPAFSTTYTLLVNGLGGLAKTNAYVAVQGAGLRLFCGAWMDGSVFIADDIFYDSSAVDLDFPNLTGAKYPVGQALSCNPQSLAVDRVRGHLYVASLSYVADIPSSRIQVWHDADTLPRPGTPDRLITFPAATGLGALAVDPAADRLYACVQTPGGEKVYILDGASAITGSIAPTAILDLPGARLALDTTHDRLYVVESGLSVIWVLDGASRLRTGAVPARAIRFTNLMIGAIQVDGPRDRLYLGAISLPDVNVPGTKGIAIFTFANAGSLSGWIADPAGAATLQIRGVRAVGLMLDAQDRLYVADDQQPGLGTCIRVYSNASLLSGAISSPGDMVIGGFRFQQGGATALDTYRFPGMDWMKH
jgi:hypothetical protein